MKNKILLIVLIVLTITPNLMKAQTKFIEDSWSGLKEVAKEQNKLIFVDLYFTGCAPCAKMDKEVFPNAEVSNYLNKHFVSFKSDILKEDIGKKLSLKYGVTGFPTFLFLNADGKIIDISAGGHSVDEFLVLISSVTKNASKEKYKKFSATLDIDYPEFYRDAYMKNKRNISFETMDNYLKEQKNLGLEIPFVVMTGLRTGGKYADYILNNAKQLANDYSRMQVRNSLQTIIFKKAKSLGVLGDLDAFDRVMIKAKPVFTEKEWTKSKNVFRENFNKYKK